MDAFAHGARVKLACPAVSSGDQFLTEAFTNIDCQAQTIGAYGWSALATPGSPVSLALAAMLTIFVAVFGIRLIVGYPQAPRDVVNDLLRVAIMLTLATSWPAWRVLGYDVIIQGPLQIAGVVSTGAGLPALDLPARLQHVYDGLNSLNIFGSGRFGVAQGDWFQLGFARVAYLGGALSVVAIIRLVAGVLLALAPLMAGLLLFGVTRGIFEGWARSLVGVFLASIIVGVLLSAELTLIEPWLADALRRRASNEAVLDAPVEILVLGGGFALVKFAALWIAFRIGFHVQMPMLAQAGLAQDKQLSVSRVATVSSGSLVREEASRAQVVTDAITENIRRGERMSDAARGHPRLVEHGVDMRERLTVASRKPTEEVLGNTWRRQSIRRSSAQRQGDLKR